MKKITLAVLVTLGLGAAAFAFGPGGHYQGPFAKEPRGSMFTLVKQLDLTSEQKEQFKTLRESRKNMMQAKRKAFKKNRTKRMQEMRPNMGTFMTADTFDKAAFKNEMNKKHESRRSMMEKRRAGMLEKRAEGMEKVFHILTPTQRIKLIELSKNK